MEKKFYHRDIKQKLLAWVTMSRRKPLVLRGARQVGKTASVRELALSSKLTLCELNFERQPELKHAFSGSLDPRSIIAELELYTEQRIEVGQTLLFFDEIQECPEAITSLRYFYEEMPSLHVIAAGSLLEFALKETSVPVGRVIYEYMYPMSFVEFLLATGRSQIVPYLPKLSEILQDSNRSKTSEAASAKLHKALADYFIVGGMPEAVAEFVTTGSYAAVGKIQDGLLQTFRDDIRKYTTGTLQIESVSDVFARMFNFVGQQIKYSKLGAGDEGKRTKKTLNLLEQAMLVKIVRSTEANGLPLGASANDKHFKCVFLDIGLGQRSNGLRPKDILTSDNLVSTYKGRLAEQFVGQQLLAESKMASEDREVYYWMRSVRSSTAEVDYLVVRDGEILPVEVKSGKSGSLKSMHSYLASHGGRGLCLQDVANVSKVGDIVFMPLYTIL